MHDPAERPSDDDRPNGGAGNVHSGNGHSGNGHSGNGHSGDGRPSNGRPSNGQPANVQAGAGRVGSGPGGAGRDRAAGSREAERGRAASGPAQIPPRGWKDVLVRVKRESKDDHLPLLSAGVALYLLLALIPALVAAISLYALVANPADIQRQIQDLTQGAPQEVRQLLATQLQRIAASSGSQATIGLLAGIAGAVWATSSGMKHLISAVNAAYGEPEDRGFVKLRGLSLLFTGGGFVLFACAIGIIAVLPPVLGDVTGVLAPIARWAPYALLAVLFVVGLSLVYRYAPQRRNPRFRWVSWGSVAATLLWIAASVGFSVYVSNFGSYNETYGSLAAIIVLILWLLITAYAVLVGAEINSELEAQTARDTTVGEPRPIGVRGARKADQLGATAEQVRR